MGLEVGRECELRSEEGGQALMGCGGAGGWAHTALPRWALFVSTLKQLC